jgi:hypothetical protein
MSYHAKKTMSGNVAALKMLGALNPQLARKITQGPIAQRNMSIATQVNSGNVIAQGVAGDNSCCPSESGGLPVGVDAPIIPDICKGIFFANNTNDMTQTIVSYQRSPLAFENNWLVGAAGAATNLTSNRGTQAIDGLVFWFPAINNVQISGFVTITIAGITWNAGAGAAVNDFTVTRQLTPALSNAPTVYGEIFRDANNFQDRLRIQQNQTVADAGGVPVTVAAQDIQVTITGWPAAAAPVQVFAFNSASTWIRPYTDLFDREL